MMKKIALTIAIVLGFGLTTLTAPNGDRLSHHGAADLIANDNYPIPPNYDFYGNQYDDSSDDGEDMILNVGILILVALAFYGIGYYVGKKKDKDDY